MLYPDNIEQKIDFTLIREWVSKECDSPLGQERCEQMSYLTDATAIIERVNQTAQMQQALTDATLSFPRGEIYDLREQLQRIRIEGLYLDEPELFSLQKCLLFARDMQAFLKGLEPARYALLINMSTMLGLSLTPVTTRLDQLLDRYGELRDSASPELARLRQELRKAEGTVARAIDRILRQAQADGLIDKDAAPTLREGRLVLPVAPAYKRKIGGIVHDESASGKTVYIEPQQVIEANNHIRELEGAERRERIRILIAFSGELRPLLGDLMQVQHFVAEVDFVRAKARVGLQLKSIAPTIVKKPLLCWQQARHPILCKRLPEVGKEVVPLDIKLHEGNRILVISGPNAGGKSVCLKTAAMMQYMLQCGMTVPAGEASQAGIFRQLMIDIGDEQSINNDLSTYSSHLRNMKHFVRNADTDTLFLIDEFGTGTEPLIGGAIAESVLLRLNEAQATGIITTHYTNLKHLAEQTEGIVNGAMLYDRGALRPLFQLSIGQAGSSFAIEIARQIGLPEDIIAQATGLIGAEHIDYDKQLQDIARDKRYWENKRQNIRTREKHLEEKIAYYEKEIGELKKKQKEMLNEAKQQAADLLEQSNATIERTIREIKEAQADKEATKKARAKVEELKQQVSTEERPQPKAAKRKKTAVAQREKSADAERLKNGKAVLHDLSELRMLTKRPELASKPSSPRPTTTVADQMRRRKLAFNRTLDMRGMRVDEALETIIAYIDDAIMVGADEVTILHGTGTGAVKQVVRDYLQQKSHAMQKRGTGSITFHDGDPDRGGAGITIVEL
ncbi:MAG: Smr/MutS family protein [Paludibacteraceae bacterium]|nr:Smr/MutS family protein [Paludibacteraceae bacterium]